MNPPEGITLEQWAAQSKEPAVGYTAHAAPMQMTFYTGTAFPEEYRGDAFIAMRGSWNRRPPSGYEISRVDFVDGKPGTWDHFAEGFLVEGEGTNYGFLARLAGITQTEDGALLLADDFNGIVYRISHEAEDETADAAMAVETPDVTIKPQPSDISINLVDAEGTVDVTSPSFANGEAIPLKHAAEGDNASPALDWGTPPEGTQSFLLIADDPDATEPKPFVHWETAARRVLNDYQARSRSRASTGSTLAAIADAIGVAAPDSASPLVTAISELETVINERLAAIRGREDARRRIRDNLSIAILQLGRRREADTALSRDRTTLRVHDAALKRAGRVRSDGQTIKGAVEAVRAQIISHAFNERLNRLWRDLFLRLAPTEPFVPAFHIPTEPPHKLKPKLVTLHRGGGAGGTPGAMLSAGNLNTAALTLFVALHMTVVPKLPWLILDDPVQSMDDVHIAHFAALLRTLSKEHGRQVIVAVHDRQLFEYLRLELSPAYEDDSLLTLELTRNATRDTGLFPQANPAQVGKRAAVRRLSAWYLPGRCFRSATAYHQCQNAAVGLVSEHDPSCGRAVRHSV